MHSRLFSFGQRPLLPPFSNALPHALVKTDITEQFKRSLMDKMPLLLDPCFFYDDETKTIGDQIREYRIRLQFSENTIPKKLIIETSMSLLTKQNENLSGIDEKVNKMTAPNSVREQLMEAYRKVYSKNIEKLEKALSETRNADPVNEFIETLSNQLRDEEQSVANPRDSVERVKAEYRNHIETLNDMLSTTDATEQRKNGNIDRATRQLSCDEHALAQAYENQNQENTIDKCRQNVAWSRKLLAEAQSLPGKKEHTETLNTALEKLQRELADPSLDERIMAVHRENAKVLREAIKSMQSWQQQPSLNFFSNHAMPSTAAVAMHSAQPEQSRCVVQ